MASLFAIIVSFPAGTLVTMTETASVRMQRHLSDDATVVGHSSDAVDILRGLARLIEGNFQNAHDHTPYPNITDRQVKVAHLRTVADALAHQIGATAPDPWRYTTAREWMVELSSQLGIKGWTHEIEQQRTTEIGTSELAD